MSSACTNHYKGSKAYTVESRTRWLRNESESGGGGGGRHKFGAKRRKFFVMPLHFLVSTSSICRFGERFRDGQYSLVSFLFAVLLR